MRVETKQKVEWLQGLFKPYMDKPVTLTFGKHTFEHMRIKEITNHPVTNFKLAPEKRKGLDTKPYTPTLIKIVFEDDAQLVFVDEDTVWSVTTNGVKAKVDKDVVTLRLEGK